MRRLNSTNRFLTSKSAVGADIPTAEKWKLDVGAQCNRLLGLAVDMDASEKAADREIAKDLRSIIERVAEFEELPETKSEV